MFIGFLSLFIPSMTVRSLFCIIACLCVSLVFRYCHVFKPGSTLFTDDAVSVYYRVDSRGRMDVREKRVKLR